MQVVEEGIWELVRKEKKKWQKNGKKMIKKNILLYEYDVQISPLPS
jgi:hypothetical protein